MRWPLLLVFLMLVAGCGAETSDISPPSASTTTATPPPTTTSAAPPTTTTSAGPTITTTTTTTTAAPATTTTTASTTTTSTTTSPTSSLVLRADGLGHLDFGDPTDMAMEALTVLLGPPVPGEEYPYGDHPLRFVYWDSIGLAVIFSDYPFYRDDGIEHLAGWAHSSYVAGLAGWDHGPVSLPLQTAEGVGIGSTLADLQSAYPDRVDLVAECDEGGPPTAAYLRFPDPDSSRVSAIRISFESLPIEPASPIAGMEAGAGPGC